MTETIVTTGMCRCCASEGLFKDVNTTYRWMGAEEIYAEMLNFCFGINLATAEDQNNGGICEVCITQLRNAANFKKQVLHTEEQFKRIHNQSTFNSEIVKVEMALDEGANIENHLVEDFQTESEFVVPIKEEIPEPPPKKKVAKASTSKVKKSRSDSSETSMKRILRKKTCKPSVPEAERKSSDAIGDVAKRKPVREFRKHQENLKCILQYSNASLIRGKNSDGYSCNFCPKRYHLPRELKTHFLLEHSDLQLKQLPKFTDHLLKLDITNLKCKLCERTFNKLDQFINHLREDHKVTMYTDVNNEIIPFKFDTDTLRCDVCGAEFTNFKILQEHMHVHFSNYYCDVCSAGFVSKRRLVGHQRRHGGGSFKCDHCDKVFSCDQKRRDHEQRIHLGLRKRNKCKFCDEKFADYWTKIDHMVKKHDVPRMILKCQACERTFENKRALTRHVKKDHLMERAHVCNVCDMKFYLKHRLKDHMLVHTGEKQFQCHVCSRWYATKKSVRQHLRCHADDRRYTCDVCGQAFVQQTTMMNHVRAKHGDKTSSS